VLSRTKLPEEGKGEEMNLAPPRSRDLHRRGSTLILAAIIAASTMAIAAPAQAAPNVAKAWGRNQEGQLGNGTKGPETCSPPENIGCSTTPVSVSGLSGVTAVSGGGDFSLALLEAGTVMAWGQGQSGQLGNGTFEPSNVPVAVKELSGVTMIAAGGSHGLALLSNGTVMAWGANGGQLGDGTNTASDVPVAVCAPGETAPCANRLSGVKAIAAGENYSLASLENGTVMAWGQNQAGQLGTGTTNSSAVPVEVTGLSEAVTAIAAGGHHSLAVLAGGTVMAWGENQFGQLGGGKETKLGEGIDVPVAVNGLTGVVAVSAGQLFSLALLSNGTVKAWGRSEEGALGNGENTGPEHCGEHMESACSEKPVAVKGLSGVTAIAAGGEHALALLGSGPVMAWGANGAGQLGDGTSNGPETSCGFFHVNPCSTTPVEVSKGAGAVINGIGAGEEHSLAFGPKPPTAGLPEAGRCVKVATGTGKYSGAACLALATKTNAKKYEWMPASVTEKLAFSGSGLETTLTTAGHSTIKCIATNIGGEWTGPKSASVNVEFQGCYNAQGQQCQTVTNPQNKSEIKLNGVAGELGYIKYEEVEGKLKIAVGLDLKPQPPMTQLAEYECTGSTETGHLEGSVIGKIMPISKMTTESKLAYIATKSGEQRPEAFQGSAKDTLITSFTSGTEAKGSGASSLNIKEYKGNNAAPMEIKAR
jgi:alpha-tubulin suppressor-like RCC1 family protein